MNKPTKLPNSHSPGRWLLHDRPGATADSDIVLPLMERSAGRGALYGLGDFDALLQPLGASRDASAQTESDVPLDVRRALGLDAGQEPLIQHRDLAAQLPFAIGGATQRLRNVKPGVELGSLADAIGRLVPIEVLIPAVRLQIRRSDLALPWMLLSAGRVVSNRKIELPASSVWVLASSLVANAPPGAYVGFRIEAGDLKFAKATQRQGDVVTVSVGTATRLRLDPAPLVDADPRISVSAPSYIEFEFANDGSVSVAAADGRAQIHDQAFEFRHAGTMAVQSGMLAIQFDVAPDTLNSDPLSTEAFVLSGTSTIAAAALAIALTTPSDPLQLPAAAGQVAWVLGLAQTLGLTWPGGPESGVRLTKAQLVVWASGYALIDLTAKRVGADDAQRFALWRLGEEALHRIELQAALPAAPALAIGIVDNDRPFVSFSALAKADLDRPRTAVGTPLACRPAPVWVTLIGVPDQRSVTLLPLPDVSAPVERPQLVVLENAALMVQTPRIFALHGDLGASGNVDHAHLLLSIAVNAWAPTLPDPYVSNFEMSRRAWSDQRRSDLLAIDFEWSTGGADMRLLGLLKPSETSAQAMSQPGTGPIGTELPDYPTQSAQGALVANRLRVGNLRRIGRDQSAFEHARRSASHSVVAPPRDGPPMRLRGLALLDVSTARHQMGVTIADDDSGARGFEDPFGGVGVPSMHPLMVVHGMRIGTWLPLMRAFALPQIQWEPVRTLEKDQDPITLGIFPTPLASADDGGPAVLVTPHMKLAASIPDLVVDGLIDAHQLGSDVAIATTLPFGMRAVMVLRGDSSPQRPADQMQRNEPDFKPQGGRPLRGALQLSLLAQGGKKTGKEDPSFLGATWQTKNGVDLVSGAPLGISVLGSTLGPAGSVENLFNNELAPGGSNPRVPLTRYELCGYGASTFSDWGNPNGSYGVVTKAQFQVMVGRTALEVIKVSSVVYPWGIRVTRSITIERKGGGGVIRKDSGWQALGPGLFDFTADGIPNQPYEIHPGLIRGIENVRRIRPLAQDALVLPDGGEVLPMAFDAEVLIDQKPDVCRAATVGMLGFLHIKGPPLPPTSSGPITAADLAALIAFQGPIGGAVDAEFLVGGSPFRARALRVEIDRASGPAPRFVGAVRAVPQFGAATSWSVVRSPGPAASDPGAETVAVLQGTPIVREGKALPGDGKTIHAPLSGPYRFADAADLFVPNQPQSDYGFMQSDTTHRFLYRRPSIFPNEQRVRAGLPPLLADFFAATTSKGLFPPAANTIALNNKPYELAIQSGTGRLRLVPDVDWLAPRPELVLAEGPSDGMRVVYDDARLRFQLHENAWTIDFPDIVLWSDFSFMKSASGSRQSLVGGSGKRAQLDRIENVLHPDLEDIFSILPMMNNRGVHGPIDLGATNLKIAWKIAAVLETKIEDPLGYAAIRLFAAIELAGENDTSSAPVDPSTEPGDLQLAGGGGFDSGSLSAKAGYEARFSIPIEPYPVAVVFGWGVELGGKLIIGGPDAGKTKGLAEISIYVGVAFGKELGPFKAKVTTGAGFLLQQEGSAVGIGGFIFLEIKASIEIAKIKVTGEFAVLCVTDNGEKYQKWSGEVAINVEVCWILSIKFSANVSDKKKLT